MKNESVVTWDVGHRYTPIPTLHIDSTFFYSQYKHLRMADAPYWACTYGQCANGSQLPANLFLQESHYNDNLSADSYGVEMAVSWMPNHSFTVNTSYSYIRTESECTGTSTCDKDAVDGYPVIYNHQPEHFLSVQTLWNINPAWQFDLWFKHKSAVSSDIEYMDGSKPHEAPSISTLDIRLAWQEKPNWPKIELIADAIGRNSYEDLPYKAAIEETVYLRASWNVL